MKFRANDLVFTFVEIIQMKRSRKNISQRRLDRRVSQVLDCFMNNFEFEESRVELYSQLKIQNIHKETGNENAAVAVASEK